MSRAARPIQDNRKRQRDEDERERVQRFQQVVRRAVRIADPVTGMSLDGISGQRQKAAEPGDTVQRGFEHVRNPLRYWTNDRTLSLVYTGRLAKFSSSFNPIR